jgi:hypothetical protein
VGPRSRGAGAFVTRTTLFRGLGPHPPGSRRPAVALLRARLGERTRWLLRRPLGVGLRLLGRRRVVVLGLRDRRDQPYTAHTLLDIGALAIHNKVYDENTLKLAFYGDLHPAWVDVPAGNYLTPASQGPGAMIARWIGFVPGP